jgi:NAD(P)-dependent dehydrogenase (short-subunit alcohol dehydrogenase family)
MPSLAAIRASNTAFTHSSNPVAVFVGGTSGIGEGMARVFAEHTKGNSDIIIVGRNRASAENIFSSLSTSISTSTSESDDLTTPAREFVQCDVTLMKNIQEATRSILTKYPKINYLVMSPGIMTLAGRDETEEGIDKLAVHYYARWKFLHDLLPALKKANEAGEKGAVMSVMAAGNGGAIDLQDLALKAGYSVQRAALSAPTYNDLMLEVSPYFVGWYQVPR